MSDSEAFDIMFTHLKSLLEPFGWVVSLNRNMHVSQTVQVMNFRLKHQDKIYGAQWAFDTEEFRYMFHSDERSLKRLAFARAEFVIKEFWKEINLLDKPPVNH